MLKLSYYILINPDKHLRLRSKNHYVAYLLYTQKIPKKTKRHE
jgi:hypothetical protein